MSLPDPKLWILEAEGKFGDAQRGGEVLCSPTARLQHLSSNLPQKHSHYCTMATDIVMDDANYLSDEDEDFNPTATADRAESESSDDNDNDIQAFKRGKTARTAEDLDFENSGDEATIQNAKSRRKKKGKKKRGAQQGHDGDEDSSMEVDLLDEEGGEGGLIKTRAQRKAEKADRRPLAGTEGATADVDAIWARLMSAPLKPAPGIDKVETTSTTGEEPSIARQEQKQADGANNGELDTAKSTGAGPKDIHPATTANKDDMITIKRSYDFAGETHVEEKRVPKDSAEARLYLSSLDSSKTAPDPEQPANPSQPLVRRPLRRPSRFEPNPTAEIRSLPPNAKLPRALYPISNLRVDKDAAAAAAAAVANQKAKAQKLNTVTKSKLDWAGFVDKEGIAEELKDYEKGGKAYLDRMDFLGRVEGRRDADARDARDARGGAAV